MGECVPGVVPLQRRDQTYFLATCLFRISGTSLTLNPLLFCLVLIRRDGSLPSRRPCCPVVRDNLALAVCQSNPIKVKKKGDGGGAGGAGKGK